MAHVTHYFLAAPQQGSAGMRHVLEESLQNSAIQSVPLASRGKTTASQYDAQQAIRQADFVIADITGNSPDVLYQVGFAHALGKPVLPIVEEAVSSENSRVPETLSGSLYLVYHPSDEHKQLGQLIRQWVDLNLSRSQTR